MANVSKTKVITGKNTRLSYFHGWSANIYQWWS